jgi:hypothetical protein
MNIFFRTWLAAFALTLSCAVVSAEEFPSDLDAHLDADLRKLFSTIDALKLGINREAAKHDPSVQYIIGNAYSYHGGLSRGADEARRWYKVSADQGYIPAQYKMAKYYMRAKNEKDALIWYRLAAAQGHTPSQMAIGNMYFDGLLGHDLVSAYMWFHIAGLNGGEYADSTTNIIEEYLTRDQINDATRRAQVCMETKYHDCGWQ